MTFFVPSRTHLLTYLLQAVLEIYKTRLCTSHIFILDTLKYFYVCAALFVTLSIFKQNSECMNSSCVTTDLDQWTFDNLLSYLLVFR